MAGMDSLLNNLSEGLLMAKERRILDRRVPHTFTIRTAEDYFMDCYMFVDRRVEYWLSHPLQQQSLLSVEDC